MKCKYKFKVYTEGLSNPYIDEQIELGLSVITESDYSFESNNNVDISLFIDALKENKCDSVALCGFRDEHISDIIPYIKDKKTVYLKSPYLTNYIFLEELGEVETILIAWNFKATKLWNVKSNKKLKKLYIVDANKLENFDGLRNANIESLSIFGCNYLSSYYPKLAIKDLSFLLEIPNLKRLELHIKKTERDEWYLSFLSNFIFLDYLFIPTNFFTFNDFALLSKALYKTSGLEPYWGDDKDGYFIIGKGSPKNLKTIEEAKKWEIKFNEIKNK